MAKFFPSIVINFCRQCPNYFNLKGDAAHPEFVCLCDRSPKDYDSKPDEYCYLSDYKEGDK